jgi:tetratricopeptide (TPR) repeat protein
MSFLVTAVILLIAAVVVYASAVTIKAIWEPSVQIEQFKDTKDGTLGRFISEAMNITIAQAQETHREADAQAVSIGTTLKIPFLKQDSRVLKDLEDLDIRIKDVPISVFVKALRVFQQPPYSIRGSVLQSKSTLSAGVELLEGSGRRTSLHVSVLRTGDDAADADKLARETTYSVLCELNKRFRAKEAMNTSNWQSLDLYTQALNDLQQYRTATRYGQPGDPKKPQDFLNAAVSKLKQVSNMDPDYTPAIYYLGVAYFESRGKEEDAIRCFEDVLSRSPEPPFSLEARFYLGYSHFRKYTEDGYNRASQQYEPLRDTLLSRLTSSLSRDEKRKTQGLLAETFCQLANVFAHRLAPLAPKDLPPEQVRARKATADVYHKEATDYSEKAEEIVQANLQELGQDVIDDIEWRRHNALGVRELRYAPFDEPSKYDTHLDLALNEFQVALQKSPGNFNILENLGRVLRDAQYSRRDLRKAEEYFLRAADLKPEDWYAYQELGNIYDALSQIATGEDKELYQKKMMESYERAADLGSTFAKSRVKDLQGRKPPHQS